jgi:hypothetical protein
MRQTTLLAALALACGQPSQGTPAPQRLTAQLTVNADAWQRLWHPPDAGMPPPMMMMPPPDGGMMMPPPGMPPQAALDACSGKADGDACSFTDMGHALSGTCGKTPEGQEVCKPAGMMPPPMMMMMDPMNTDDSRQAVLGGTLAGLTSSPVLVVVRPTADNRVTVSCSNPAFTLVPDDGDVDLSIDHGDGFVPAGAYRRANP